ncbi:EamA family transporter [Planotetraspora sp. GP83]|uniref:EamA family transporter n=1 Tax=Planotetraspora sp. GP83 TaxID=3156264 RepID=UPI00351616CF
MPEVSSAWARLLCSGGAGFLWIKIALRGFSPTQVTLIRLVLGALVLTVVVYAQGRRLPRGWKLWGHLTVAALLANAAPYLLFAIGERSISSSAQALSTPRHRCGRCCSPKS